MKPHVVLVCPEPIRPLQQGVGIRFREIARELSVHYRVSLWAAQVDAGVACDGFTVRLFPEADFARELAGVDAVVIHGHVSDRYFDALERSGLGGGPPLVVDLFDPFLVENLQYVRDLGEGVYRRDLRVLTRQLAAGDLFLISSEQQRLFYAGLMMAAGLFDPASYAADPTLSHLFAVAPFGVSPFGVRPAAQSAAVPPLARGTADAGWKGVIPGIEANDTIAFFGGIYDWYDPELLIDAVEPLCREFPALRVLFSANPNPEATPQSAYARARTRAEAKGLAGRHVFFVPWFPYHERDLYLRDVDVAVCLHRSGLEADLSLRTRILEFLRAGLPVIATTGGETSHILNASGAGLLVPPGEVDPLRDALATLLADAGTRSRMGAAGRDWVCRERPWTRTLQPLLAFCAQPRKRSSRTADLSTISAQGARTRTARAPASTDAPPAFSVIVPTHNRLSLLGEVLAALEAQEDAPPFEVIVVDDGSRDETRRWLAQNANPRVRVVSQSHRGAAAARNTGIRLARGRIVAFLGDDTVPEPGWLAAHHARHEAAGHDPQLAVIGRVAWHRRIKVTPFLEYINEQGKQFGFSLIEDPRDLPFYFFYTANASLHRETAGRESFDERFPYAAWEDVEFAYRLKRRGLRIDYEAAARVAHDHPTSIGRFMKRQERVGYSAVIFYARHPELGPFLGLGPEGPPPDTRALRERLIALNVRALDRLGISSPGQWDEILRLSYLGGLHRGWREPSLRVAGGAV
jgi:glycosyltransferase involved in cell wall biosynthesis